MAVRCGRSLARHGRDPRGGQDSQTRRLGQDSPASTAHHADLIIGPPLAVALPTGPKLDESRERPLEPVEHVTGAHRVCRLSWSSRGVAPVLRVGPRGRDLSAGDAGGRIGATPRSRRAGTPAPRLPASLRYPASRISTRLMAGWPCDDRTAPGPLAATASFTNGSFHRGRTSGLERNRVRRIAGGRRPLDGSTGPTYREVTMNEQPAPPPPAPTPTEPPPPPPAPPRPRPGPGARRRAGAITTRASAWLIVWGVSRATATELSA